MLRAHGHQHGRSGGRCCIGPEAARGELSDALGVLTRETGGHTWATWARGPQAVYSPTRDFTATCPPGVPFSLITTQEGPVPPGAVSGPGAPFVSLIPARTSHLWVGKDVDSPPGRGGPGARRSTLSLSRVPWPDVSDTAVAPCMGGVLQGRSRGPGTIRGHRPPQPPSPGSCRAKRGAGADALTDTSSRLPWPTPAARPAPARSAAPGVRCFARAARKRSFLCRLTWRIANIVANYPKRRFPACSVGEGRLLRGAARGHPAGWGPLSGSPGRPPDASSTPLPVREATNVSGHRQMAPEGRNCPI